MYKPHLSVALYVHLFLFLIKRMCLITCTNGGNQKGRMVVFPWLHKPSGSILPGRRRSRPSVWSERVCNTLRRAVSFSSASVLF